MDTIEKEVKILILDLFASSGLGNLLKKILLTSNFDIQLQQESIHNHFHTRNCMIRNTIINNNPDLTFLVLPSSDLEQTYLFLQCLNRETLMFPIIVVMERCDIDIMISLLDDGFADFITPPLKKIDIIPRIWRLINYHKRQIESFSHALKEKVGLKQLVGKSSLFLEEVKKIPIVAKCDTTVLILGETGTGKELFARSIHYLSPRTDKAFIPVNCGAIPVELVENEMFGHVRGAYTGASISGEGLIHKASGGTLFLDEIDSLSLAAQVKLLRFIQDKVYRQLGSTKLRQTDIRIIAASNHNLEEALIQGKFRRDLFYRLNIISFKLPLLRDRKEDIPILARHFLNIHSYKHNKQFKDFTSEALQKLLVYDWPGNVRELENVIETSVIFSKQLFIQSSDIILPSFKVNVNMESLKAAKSRAIEEFEKNYIQNTLLANKGNITKAANSAQKNRRAFWELIRKYNINVQYIKSLYQ